jgi:hypothetical protein
MVTRINKSSKNRNESEYMLLWRTARDLGVNGKSIVERAINCEQAALDLVEELAWHPKKRPALVTWVDKKRADAKRAKRRRLQPS